MSNKLLLISSLMAIAAGCALPEQEAASSGSVTSGGGGGTPVPGEPGPVQPAPSPLPYQYTYHADCDGDGVKDCWITVIRFGPLGGFATQIAWTHPVTLQPVVEVICNGDYNGEDPKDPSDDEPCNAPICSEDGPNPPPDVSFPPDGDGPCADNKDATGEVCVPWGDAGSIVCDCIYPDSTTETGLSPTYPDDTNGDGVNDCPP